MTQAHQKQKTALITGGTGGLGAATASLLVAQGWHVFIGDINAAALEHCDAHANMTAIPLDVADTESVEQAVAAVTTHTKHLDAVINFAGILVTGSVAEIPVDTMERVLNINVLGTYRVNQAFLPLLLEGNGRIINISSETGWQSGAPFNGAYATSKHAIEAYSDSLRRELSFLDIPVIKIQPGAFKTDMVSSIGQQFDHAIAESSLFKAHLTKIKSLGIKEQEKAHDPALLANTLLKALTDPKPAAAYSVKPDAGRSFLEKLPTSWADALIKAVIRP